MIATRRLVAQHVARPAFTRPAELVAWLGAVQAQDYAACKWAVGLRLRDATEATIDAALAEGSILRTHIFRGTWQLVVPADVRWMLELAGARLLERWTPRLEELGLDAATLRKSEAAIEKALRGGHHLTRAEIGAVLERTGVAPGGQRLPHILGHAELRGLLVSGTPRGKQVTFALLDERVPARRGRRLTRDDAAVELAGRYLRSRGPASVQDFAWWSGLPMAEARSAYEAIDSTDLPPPPVPAHAYLLPAFDELLVAYKDRTAMMDPAHARGGGLLDPVVVWQARVVGRWRRELDGTSVKITIDPFEDLSGRAEKAIATAARRYGAFLGLEAQM